MTGEDFQRGQNFRVKEKEVYPLTPPRGRGWIVSGRYPVISILLSGGSFGFGVKIGVMSLGGMGLGQLSRDFGVLT